MAKIVKQKHWWSLKVLQKWETANPNWRPKKWISLVNKQLSDLWYTPATKADIEENYMQLLQLKEEELQKLFKDKDQPMLVKILASNMTGKKNFDVIERMLDRWIWKAIQKQEITWKDWEAIEIKEDSNLKNLLKNNWLI